ncbi:MAG: FumA C-terminus/TtdB family hydratase beta subunit [Candidatus Bipolaricaulis sp.]|nr:FumA C-terminus/TtdB family hydratase beta subunit [Candidatus Bipolaricaulis sp.]
MTRDLHLPIDERAARDLRAGDVVHVSGTVFTARDVAHRRLLEAHAQGQRLPFDPAGLALYHCGPVVRPVDGGWRVLSAGPTTSARMEPLEVRFLEVFRPRLVIGKGGMGDRTLEALGHLGAAYAHFPGGAGALAARRVTRVRSVYGLEEWGMPEAVWVLDVEHFGPLLITMDSAGRDLHRDRRIEVAKNLQRIRARLG